jgi:hypothetical protein
MHALWSFPERASVTSNGSRSSTIGLTLLPLLPINDARWMWCMCQSWRDVVAQRFLPYPINKDHAIGGYLDGAIWLAAPVGVEE